MRLKTFTTLVSLFLLLGNAADAMEMLHSPIREGDTRSSGSLGLVRDTINEGTFQRDVDYFELFEGVKSRLSDGERKYFLRLLGNKFYEARDFVKAARAFFLAVRTPGEDEELDAFLTSKGVYSDPPTERDILSALGNAGS